MQIAKPSIQLSALALAIFLATAASPAAYAQNSKKPAAAPAKPAPAAPRPAAPAVSHAAPSMGGASHAGTSAVSHGPSTSGPTTGSHGLTTSGPTTGSHGPTTSGLTTGSHGPTTAGSAPGRGFNTTGSAGGRPGEPGRPGAAPGRPNEMGHGGNPSIAHGPMSHPAPMGGHDMHTAHGDVRMDRGGHVRDVHDERRGMDIHHNLGGGRRVVMERPDHSRLYYERGRPGYISHPYMYHGHEFARRTYYYNGRAYDRFYRPYGFHGVDLEVYSPTRFYSLGFYGWAYHPWGAPIRYGWGWGGTPWFGYYGAYFTPYPVYAAPNLWLTDYLIAQSLQAQYDAAIAAGPPPAPLVGYYPLTPDVKQEVAEEVQRQLALESSEAQQNAANQELDPASSGIARMLSDGQRHVFVAGKEVDVTDATGQECAVTDGDVIQLTNPPGPNDNTASMMVLSSKGGTDCRNSAVVQVGFDDLQDMQNHMRETVDLGLQELQAKQGHGGLPTAPPSAMAPPSTAEEAQNAPPPDPTGAAELTQQATQADQSEKDVLQGSDATAPASASASASVDSPIAPPPAPADVSIDKGQTTDQVKAALGTPTRIVNLGSKTMYFYKDMKVTFIGGKVSDIQ